MRNCREWMEWDGGGEFKLQIFRKKTPQVHLNIIKELPTNTPSPILRNLDSFPSGVLYSTPPPPTPYTYAQKNKRCLSLHLPISLFSFFVTFAQGYRDLPDRIESQAR